VVNSDNELTSVTNGGTLTVMGTTTSAATNVTVNGNPASRYGDSTFAAAGLSLTSSYTAVASDTNGRWATNTVNVDLAASIPYQYDLNGNLTNDGLRSFAYDDENQLIQVWVPGQWSSVFTYDGKMRRRIRQEFTWTNSAWLQTNAVYYVYDGNLVIQERDVNNLPTTTYTRGKDLSGSLQGAGGICGLLARTSQQYADGPLAGNAFYHADANGNVTMLVNSSQAVVAKYLYDAFGNVLSASGLLAEANRYQFSSKEKDLGSGLVYYLYRFYDPNLQRWPNRDPLREQGFELLRVRLLQRRWLGESIHQRSPNRAPNLYLFVKNSPLMLKDDWGLDAAACAQCWATFHQQEDDIESEYADCMGQGARTCLVAPPMLRSLCLLAAADICGSVATASQVAVAAQLAGCLSGCQPPNCPLPSSPLPIGPPSPYPPVL
jgi:RHS repeat-associated protein